MILRDMDRLLKLSGADLDFLLLLNEYLQEKDSSLVSLLEWINDKESDADETCTGRREHN